MTDITTPAQMREAAARLAEKRAKYTMEAIKNATASALVSNIVTVTEAKVAHFIAAAIRALPVAEPAPVAVRVKPLVAGRHPRGFIATDHGGGAAYIFALNGGRYECIKGLAHSPRFDTSKEALAAAQADHAARVLSQIDAVPAAQVRSEALEEAATKATSFLVGDPQNGVPLRNPMAHEIAASIRALIEKEQT